jgi:uncharacterized UBP type Zn finger protein
MPTEICDHLPRSEEPAPRTPEGCEECLAAGDRWVHLRLCLDCGQVGCCNDSKNRHAMKHAQSTGHPVIRSLEPGERWQYCYPDDAFYDPA